MGLFAQIKKGEKRMLQNTSAGLSEAEAKARLAKVGENRLRGKKGASVAAMFFSQFKDLMILILAAATLISVLMGEGTEAITIIIIVLMNATMGFLQEYRTEKTLEALKELSAPTARVRRSGRELEVGARTVVPGQAQTKHAVSVLPLRITAKTARKAFVSLAVNLSVCKFIYFLFKSINVLPEYGK